MAKKKKKSTNQKSSNRNQNVRRGSARSARLKKKKKMDNIQLIAVVVILLVVVAVVWLATRGQASQANAVPTIAAGQTTPAAASAGTQSASVSTPKQWSSPPPMTIDVTKQYFATVKMAKGGEFLIQLFPDKAPITVNSFVFLARQGFYDGTTFHRVLPDFMAQGGDPTGTGMGGPGYEFQNEDSDLTFDKAGVVAMANAGRDTNGSQFFITFGPQDYLNGGYTIFGQVIQGMDVVTNLRLRDPQTNPSYTGDVIESITITEK